MKRRAFTKKLRLSRETLRDLDSQELSRIAGGRPTYTECSNPCPCDGSDGEITDVTCFSQIACGTIGC